MLEIIKNKKKLTLSIQILHFYAKKQSIQRFSSFRSFWEVQLECGINGNLKFWELLGSIFVEIFDI